MDIHKLVKPSSPSESAKETEMSGKATEIEAQDDNIPHVSIFCGIVWFFIIPHFKYSSIVTRNSCLPYSLRPVLQPRHPRQLPLHSLPLIQSHSVVFLLWLLLPFVNLIWNKKVLYTPLWNLWVKLPFASVKTSSPTLRHFTLVICQYSLAETISIWCLRDNPGFFL